MVTGVMENYLMTKKRVVDTHVIEVLRDPTCLDITPIDPYTIMLLEYREDEVLRSGIVLMAVSTQKFGQVDIIPKWKVVAVGEKVSEFMELTPGDMVVVSKMAGKLRDLGNFEVRIVHHTEVLAKLKYEPKDFSYAFNKTNTEGWTKLYSEKPELSRTDNTLEDEV